MQVARWKVFTTVAELRDAAINVVLDAANTAVAARGRFDVVLAGGTTPRDIYQALRNAQADWPRWHIWYGDERCLPADDDERNSKMAQEVWLNHVHIPDKQIHTMLTERGTKAAVADYNQALSDVDDFDLVLLGMGEDGHTASLFPGHAWGDAAPAIAVSNAPKPPADRVSLSALRLSQARQVLFIVTGSNKRDAVQQWRNGFALPVTAIDPKKGVDVFVDAAALPA
ncbi:MAG: 6-phosphogluconolactonase [Methylophilales bacterium]|nr:6-phosphogluconolactonase [Methylophilales bacterium]